MHNSNTNPILALSLRWSETSSPCKKKTYSERAEGRADFFKEKRSFYRPIRACCSKFVPMESLQTSGQTCTGGASWNYATNAVGKAHILPRKSYNWEPQLCYRLSRETITLLVLLPEINVANVAISAMTLYKSCFSVKIYRTSRDHLKRKNDIAHTVNK